MGLSTTEYTEAHGRSPHTILKSVARSEGAYLRLKNPEGLFPQPLLCRPNGRFRAFRGKNPPRSRCPIFAFSHFLILILSHSHIAFVTFRALVRIQGRKFGIITINERSKPMNNEPNKPVELTEKELEGVAGGGRFITLQIRACEVEIPEI